MNALPIRSLLAVAALAVLSGCSSVDSWFAHRDPNANYVNLGANPPPVAKPAANPSEKPIVLPVASQDINCPTVDIAEGGAALRVGGADNASVRYQFNIADTARECDPAGPGQATLKIGVTGEVVIGPAGSAGTYSAPLKIAVTHNIDKKEVFSKTFKVEATTDGVQAGGFRVVTEPIPLPLTTLQLVDEYSIAVGFTSGGASAPPKRHKQKNAG
ncbi:MAG TPA: hypothetical protein VKG91_13695 [Roseiarcus sp.]|nr:hypothetical protein [Roseiarcus sp.]